MPHVSHPLFVPPGQPLSAELEAILATKVRHISGQWYVPFLLGDGNRLPKPDSEPWNFKEEQTIFIQWNYHRRAAELYFSTDAERAGHAATAKRLGEQIAEANLGLVCSMVSKQGPAVDGDRDEMISQAQAALLRAMDKFDVLLGWKFSTYCCAAIHRALRRWYRQAMTRQHRLGQLYESTQSSGQDEQERSEEEESHLRTAMARVDLTEHERFVIEKRFFSDPPLTLVDTGKLMVKRDGTTGITKERVRQIQMEAMTKIRESYLGMLDK